MNQSLIARRGSRIGRESLIGLVYGVNSYFFLLLVYTTIFGTKGNILFSGVWMNQMALYQ